MREKETGVEERYRGSHGERKIKKEIGEGERKRERETRGGRETGVRER